MSISETDIANLALGKIGGAGEALSGTALITSIDGTDKVSSWLKLYLPRARRRSIKNLAVAGKPFRSTVRFVDLGAVIAVPPEIGGYEFAFNVPADALVVTSLVSEDNLAARNQPSDYRSDQANLTYQFEQIANSVGTGLILLTNTLTNSAGDGAFIEYCIDTPNTASFNEELIDCIATLLASGVSPVVGKDLEVGQRMLVEYLQSAVPAAKKANQADFNFSARSISNYKGGRAETLRNNVT